MSRLDSFIRRLSAQRDVIDSIVDRIGLQDGPVIELGLGNGRTFDHLRERLPDRRIIAFDRACGANRRSMPPEGCLVLGEIRETAAAYAGIGAALVHADIGTSYPEVDACTLEWLPDLVVSLLAPNGIASSGLALQHPELTPLPLPESVAPERYFLYRRVA